MREVIFSLLVWSMLVGVINGWLLNFDIVPNSHLEKNVISLKSCRLNYWTQHNTECMDGCSMIGELRYGPNYLSSSRAQEFPYSVGISCRMQGLAGIFSKGGQKEDYWMKMDICTSAEHSLAEVLSTELNYDSRRFLKDSVIISNAGTSRRVAEPVYVGAYYMSSIGERLRYRHAFYKYVKYSLVVDLLLICLLVVNSVAYRYRLIRLNKGKGKLE
ncbi:putative signal peptide and transmembrane domain-containing protein [Cryptosporidium canis]|uniref:Signal peptide and transmembrane domain-containing protein n=1 Tax=Cryptosporidium canis TaxID=195482 RepID=A0ABQ8P602_9CRYT|nr:putative signal peptide and transmembrane domain-containing protein [Cryptosporidium canis]KAJ1609776.1 putative signal peptide and transmembrane domain-containing protein [Cryptosporidium canis]